MFHQLFVNGRKTSVRLVNQCNSIIIKGRRCIVNDGYLEGDGRVSEEDDQNSSEGKPRNSLGVLPP